MCAFQIRIFRSIKQGLCEKDLKYIDCRLNLNLNLRGHAYNIFRLPFEPIDTNQVPIVGSESRFRSIFRFRRKVPIKVPRKVPINGSDRNKVPIKYLTLLQLYPID